MLVCLFYISGKLLFNDERIVFCNIYSIFIFYSILLFKTLVFLKKMFNKYWATTNLTGCLWADIDSGGL